MHEKSIRLRRQREEYDKFSKSAGLLTQNERNQVVGFGRSEASRASWAVIKSESSNKMAGKSNDWSKAIPQSHSETELNDLAKYAESKNISFRNLRKFDGDIKLLKEQLDIISDLCTEFKIDRRINIGFNNMDDDDFAETKGYTILYNKNVLRDRSVTESNLSSDGHLVAFDTSGVTIHEMGHILSKFYNIDGLDIFKKSFYNIYKMTPTTTQSINYLNDYVSDYSTTPHYNDKNLNSTADKVEYNEIAPEMLVMHKTIGDDLADEFVRLIKEGITHEST